MLSQTLIALMLACLATPATLTPDHKCSACQRWHVMSLVLDRGAHETACAVQHAGVGYYYDELGESRADETIYLCVTVRRCSRGHELRNFRTVDYLWPMFAERLARSEFERRYGPIDAGGIK